MALMSQHGTAFPSHYGNDSKCSIINELKQESIVLPLKSSFSLKQKQKINTHMWFVKKCSLYSGEMHMESSIIAMNPPKKSFFKYSLYYDTKSWRLPCPHHYLYIWDYSFQNHIRKTCKGKTHLHPLKSNLTYSSECIETWRCKQMCEINT